MVVALAGVVVGWWIGQMFLCLLLAVFAWRNADAVGWLPFGSARR